MNALWLLIGIFAGAGVVAALLVPRLRTLTAGVASAGCAMLNNP